MKSLKDIANRSFLSLEDLVTLEEFILNTGYMNREKALQEIERFAIEFGIDEYYFKTTSIDDIARHLIAISASELVSKYGGEGVGIEIINEQENRAVYIVETSKTEEIEERIENKYPMCRLESYRIKKKSDNQHLRIYIVTKPTFKKVSDKKKYFDFNYVADKSFLKISYPETIARYKSAWEWMGNRVAPYIFISEKSETDETRVMVGIHGRAGRQFLSNFTRLIHRYRIFTNRKYMEPFFDQKLIISFYFSNLDKKIVEELSREINTMVMLPQNPVKKLFLDGTFGSQPTMYAISAATFTNQFLTDLTKEYLSLSAALKDQPEAKGMLDKMKLRLIKDTFSESRIARSVIKHHKIVSLLYDHFANKLYPQKKDYNPAKMEELINTKIETDVPSVRDKTILKYFLTFNKMILKTNFFNSYKICAAYRLDSSFLNKIDFPEKPYGIFFVVGRQFLGFHIRFRDIARGGIRIVRSRNLSEYKRNLDTIFMENYNLALTQQKKNKDIPEGGSKGTILLDMDNQGEGDRAFKDYVDGLLDIIIEQEETLDFLGEKEILFLGPDEGTAELMNWAPFYAKKRKYPFWKAFTTGKASKNGGIPHDTYGMTTAGVHEYVLSILEKLNLEEKDISKVQTGGPDGDLGSNEIIISKDRTVAIVDGSGVLYDPEGINKKELLRLARNRIMVENFDRAILSANGFFVSVDDKKITLPDGTFIPNGEEFRNSFHLHPLARADLFVPCGGRPAAVNINNWQQLFDDRGNPKFKIIVEGANLFITEDARLRLEEHGIILIKDASANKGGVTSSSLEVFASLALNDDEFEAHMRVRDGKVTDFMKSYVDEIIKIIKSNARSEFNLLWNEHEKKGVPFTVLTNKVSRKINNITDAIFHSDLPANIKLRENIITEYTPDPLLKLIGLENILERVPENYLNAIVASKVATNFVYKFGMESNEIDFYNYLRNFMS